MSTAVAAEPIPLHLDTDRVLRVGGTRVPLETVIQAFEDGATPEDIAQDFPVLQLDDLYAVLTYCLRHRDEVKTYVERRRKEAATTRSKVEAKCSQAGLRQRLKDRLKRRNSAA